MNARHGFLTGLLLSSVGLQGLAAGAVGTDARALVAAELRASSDSPALVGAIVQQAYLKASNTQAGDQFGAGIAISGDTLVIGAAEEDSSATGIDGNESDNGAMRSGAVYVFVRTGTTWTQQAYIKASNTDANDLFGNAVALSGDTLVVGSVSEDSAATGINGDQSDDSAPSAGAAYVFVRSGTTWTQQAYLKASNTHAGDNFGNSVAVSEDVVVVGAIHESSGARGINGNQNDTSAPDAGAAYVFARVGTTWTQQAYLKASNADEGDDFGRPVRLFGDTLVVGAIYESSAATGINGNGNDNSAYRAGAAYVFTHTGATWTQQAYLKASNTEELDTFGTGAAIGDDLIVIGAYREDSSSTGVGGNQTINDAIDSGAAYVFVRAGTTWSQQAYLKASNTQAGDQFGQASVLGDVVAIASIFEDSSATGIDGNQNDNGAVDSGGIYIFERTGTVWSQKAYVKASNTGAGDSFSKSYASGDTLAVSAAMEDSNAVGIDGAEDDNSAVDSGAVYVFTGFGIQSTTTTLAETTTTLGGNTTTTLFDEARCGRPVTAGSAPKTSDCLYILRVAVGSLICSPACICDVNSSGKISSSDALVCLKKAVGQPVALDCPCL